jgi:DNA-binding PadR family transcriptional regulator
MARQNKSRYAVLGFLSWKPGSGYDIRRAISESVGNFWNESYGQIYPALRGLEREGFAQRAVEETAGKPDRHVYTITEAGRRELRRWLDQPCDPHIYRVEVLIKLFFGEQARMESSLAHLVRYRAEHEALIARYEAIREHLLRDLRDDLRLPFWLLTVECGLRVGRAYLGWCDDATKELQSLAAAGAVHAAPRSRTRPARTRQVARRGRGPERGGPARTKAKGGTR